MKFIKKIALLFISILVLSSNSSIAQSGGVLSSEQAAYDVKYYNLDIQILPVPKVIIASLLCQVEIIDPIETLVLDLDYTFLVDHVLIKIGEGAYSEANFDHSDLQVNIEIPEIVEVGDMVTVEIFYSGPPRIANNPPWGVGFVWETTPDGDPWLAVACEDQGADIWWPCKDHPSDEPDSMHMSFTVPNPLMCVSNGQYLGFTDNGDNTSTFNWFISTPINNYNVTFYAAEFLLIEDDYESTIGNTIPFRFWVLPESYDIAMNYMDVFQQEFDYLEEICGPFPFGTDKHGWGHAPYWGMEHQTIIAYGHNFTTNNWGYDYIHYHELAHEWWGNLVTAKDWADVWIHEGIATYTEALYVEHMSGMDAYFQFMLGKRPNNNHSHPLAPYDEMTAGEAFDNLNPYSRGASVMHTLRYHLGDEVFSNLLKRWAYPDPDDLDNTHGRLCRILTTEDLKVQAEEVTGVDLDPFFDVFMREAAYPELNVERQYNQTLFQWETENNVLLDVNIPIRVNDMDYTVEMVDGQGIFEMTFDDDLDIDPHKWILMATPNITVSIDENIDEGFSTQLMQNYPNPFNASTKIQFTNANEQMISLKVYDLLGNEVLTLVNEFRRSGVHEVSLDAHKLASGSYFYCLQAGEYKETRQLFITE